jgi:PBP1b-binding outer membrane lipoprotein LpoB
VKLRFMALCTTALMVAACAASPSPSQTQSPSPSQTVTSGSPTDSASASPSDTYTAPPVVTKDWLTVIDRVVAANKYWSKFTYPEFSATKSGNATLDTIVSALNKETQSFVTSFQSRTKKLYAKTAKADWVASTMNLTGIQEIGSTHLLFVRFEHYEMSFDQAHGGGATWTEVFDLRTGAKLNLEDQIRSDKKENFIDIVVQTLIAQVGAEALDDSQTMWDQLNSWGDFICWSVADEGLSVTFNEYVVGPYASGTPAISIKWQALNSIIDPKSVIGKEFADQLNFK